MTDLAPILKQIAARRVLEPADLETVFEALLTGKVPAEQAGAFLMGLAVRGETKTELVSGARILRQKARRVDFGPGPLLDTCGTGGLGWTSLNTSTLSALIIAACGGRVAKHGNRSVPPKTGSADVLEALGINLEADETCLKAAMNEAGICFLFARAHHSAMRHLGSIRASLGIRSIFNLLGPLSNPAGATHQILGVNDPRWLRPMAEALQALGTERAFIVHGTSDESNAHTVINSIDELSIAGTTEALEVTPEKISARSFRPENAGLQARPLKTLSGGAPQHNARAVMAVLSGEASVFRDAAILNAAAGLVVLGLASELKTGADMARAAIDSGAARDTLEKLKTASNQSEKEPTQ